MDMGDTSQLRCGGFLHDSKANIWRLYILRMTLGKDKHKDIPPLN